MGLSTTTNRLTLNDELLLIKAAHNGSIEAENMLFSNHKNRLEKSLHKYNFLHSIIADVPHQIESNYRIAIHKYRIESNVKFINFVSWFIKNILERICISKCSSTANLATN